MRFFVTGASGFIGRALAERLRADGHEVAGCDLVPDPAAGVVAGDVAVPGPWQAHAAGSDVVIHTAAVVSFRLEDYEGVWRANVLGTRHALDAAQRAGARRFVHFSSVTVFGNDFPDGADEHHPVKPTGIPYPDTKIASEQVALAAHGAGELEVVVVRPGDVYGPRSRAWATLPAQAILARRFALPARGRGVFSPVYVDNLVDGVVLAATHADAAGLVLTLTDGIGPTTAEFFAPYAALLGRWIPALPTPLAVVAAEAARRLARGGDVNAASARYLARTGTYSNARARTVLGWAPEVGLEEGQARTVDWLREQGYGQARPASAAR